MDECEHNFETSYCSGCGAFLGFTCVHCGEWYDGGDPHCQDIEDCTCGVEVEVAPLDNQEDSDA